MRRKVGERWLLVGVLMIAIGAWAQQDLYYIDVARQACWTSKGAKIVVNTPTASATRSKIHVPAFFRTANHTMEVQYSLTDAAGIFIVPSNNVILPAHAIARRLSADGGELEVTNADTTPDGAMASALELAWDDDAMATMCEDFFLADGREPVELPDTWGEAREAFRGLCETDEVATCQADESTLFEGHPAGEESFAPSDRFCAGLADYYASRQGVVALLGRRLKGSASGGGGYRGTNGQQAVGGWDSKSRTEMASYGYTTSRMGSTYPHGYTSASFGYSGRSIRPMRATTVVVVGAGALGGYGTWRWIHSTGKFPPSSCSESPCTYDLSGQGLIRDDMMQYGFKPAEMRYPLTLTIKSIIVNSNDKETMCSHVTSANQSEYGKVVAFDLFFGVMEVDELEEEAHLEWLAVLAIPALLVCLCCWRRRCTRRKRKFNQLSLHRLGSRGTRNAPKFLGEQLVFTATVRGERTCTVEEYTLNINDYGIICGECVVSGEQKAIHGTVIGHTLAWSERLASGGTREVSVRVIGAGSHIGFGGEFVECRPSGSSKAWELGTIEWWPFGGKFLAVRRDVHDTSSNNRWHPFESVGPLQYNSTLRATIDWNDQGWGNLKGRVRAVLRRNGMRVGEVDLFGIAPHTRTVAHSESITIEGHRPSLGDLLDFEYHVGGGGGHQLHIHSFILHCSPVGDASNDDIVVETHADLPIVMGHPCQVGDNPGGVDPSDEK